ncbi:hypothetical protein XENTR_v10011402 [Xenopus tropicalis]|nr:hypothetical protein XENTR_v10011402 [Xenopus tropicalis]
MCTPMTCKFAFLPTNFSGRRCGWETRSISWQLPGGQVGSMPGQARTGGGQEDESSVAFSAPDRTSSRGVCFVVFLW